MKTSQLKQAHQALLVCGVFIAFVARAAPLQCGDTIATSTRLTHDLECSGQGEPALRITGAGVILDLGGHTVRGVGAVPGPELSRGIVAQADSTVRNGVIRGFDQGYVLESSFPSFPEHVQLSRLTFLNNGAAVHNMSTQVTLTITDSFFMDNRVGLGTEMDASIGTYEVRSSLFVRNGLAFSANFHDVDVVDSIFALNETVFWCPAGQVFFRSSRLVFNSVVGNIPLGEFGYGSCNEVRFTDSLLSFNASFAPASRPAWEPFVLVMHNSQITDNRAGLLVRSRTIDIDGNTFRSNASGLTLAEPPEFLQPEITGTVSDNFFLRNRGDGLRVRVPSPLTVSGNIAIENTGFGIHAQGVIDGGGNVARGNGEGNCEGVACTP